MEGLGRNVSLPELRTAFSSCREREWGKRFRWRMLKEGGKTVHLGSESRRQSCCIHKVQHRLEWSGSFVPCTCRKQDYSRCVGVNVGLARGFTSDAYLGCAYAGHAQKICPMSSGWLDELQCARPTSASVFDCLWRGKPVLVFEQPVFNLCSFDSCLQRICFLLYQE